MKTPALHWQILIAIILAVLFGVYFNQYIHAVTWMGVLFLRALKMLIVPLILTSIASGIANIGSGDALGKMGIKTLAYYLTTSIFAILTGLLLVNLIGPGKGVDAAFMGSAEAIVVPNERPSLERTLYEIIPTNIFSALTNAKMLSIIFFGLLAGYFITTLTKKHKEFMITGLNAGFELMMKLTNFVIKFTPIGVFGLVAKTVADHVDELDVLAERLGMYSLTVACALLVHFLIVLPILLKVLGKINPRQHLKSMTVPLLTAFSTSSSAATLPLTINAIEKKAGASNKVTSFVLPLGATINMDGTALYECVAVMFLAQLHGIELSIVEQSVVVSTALLASIGAAGIPMAGLVMMSVVLSAVNLPLEWVAVIFPVDRILDMGRTAVNVWSDSCGAVIIAKSEGETLNYQ